MASDSKKRTPWWKEKEAIRAKKDEFKALLEYTSPTDYQSRYIRAKSGNFGSKEIQEVMRRAWSSVGFQLFFGKQSILADHPPYAWQKIERHVLTQRFCSNILTDENEILSRWREYFEDLLNPVKASTHDTQEVIHSGEEKLLTAAEVATAIKWIKSGKAAGEDEIRPEMLKALLR